MDPSPAADLIKAAKGDADVLALINKMRKDQNRVNFHLLMQGYIRQAGGLILGIGGIVTTIWLAKLGHPVPAGLTGAAGLAGSGYVLKRPKGISPDEADEG